MNEFQVVKQVQRLLKLDRELEVQLHDTLLVEQKRLQIILDRINLRVALEREATVQQLVELKLKLCIVR